SLGARRQSLPLHRLHEDRRCGRTGAPAREDKMSVRADRQRSAAVGRSVARIDGAEKACGALAYPQDLTPPAGCLYAAAVRAPLAHAHVLGIDTRDALAVSGVLRVLTAADVGGSNRFGLIEPDQPVLVEERIRGASDVLALVVGTC